MLSIRQLFYQFIFRDTGPYVLMFISKHTHRELTITEQSRWFHFFLLSHPLTTAAVATHRDDDVDFEHKTHAFTSFEHSRR